MIDLKKKKVQEEAIEKWLKHDQRGTVEIITGLGKTFIAFNAIKHIPKPCNVLILAETELREANILEDADKYNQLYDSDPFKDCNIRFMCYQSAHKHYLKDIFQNDLPTFVICDEIHDMLTPVYFQFAVKNLIGNDIPVIGLSATIDKKTKYLTDAGEEYKKTDLLNQFAPVVYKYSVNQGQEDETSRKLKMYIIQHDLDNSKSIIKAGNKNVQFTRTEKQAYDFLDKRFKSNLFLPLSNKSREFLIRFSANRKHNERLNCRAHQSS